MGFYTECRYLNSSEAYQAMLPILQFHGEDVPSRLGMTKELSTVIDIAAPQYMVPFALGRKFNYFGMLAESLWILSDLEEFRFLTAWNGNLGNFSDDGFTLYGAYGPRIQKNPDQLQAAIQCLREDPNSRQAIITILRPMDAGHKTKDYPCNDMVMFKIRQGHLNMTVMNRSNDIHWGLFGVNTAQFGMLMRYVAGRLGVPVGIQTHVSDSLHLYMDTAEHQDITKEMNKFKYNNVRDFNPVEPFDIPRNLPPIFGIHGTHQNVSLRNWFEYLTEHNLEDMKLEDSHISPEMDIYQLLLAVYAGVKNRRITRHQAIEIIGGLDRIPNELAWYHFPADWIFGCLYTLVSQMKDRQSGADHVVQVWKDLMDVPSLGEGMYQYLLEG